MEPTMKPGVAVPLPPIERRTSVSWSQADAFRRFTANFATWWPSATHSIGGKRVKRIVFECRVGGRIYEELVDGRRYQWGRITAWEPPTRVAFTWHPSKDESVAQDVDVRFLVDGAGTEVVLSSSGWEKLGDKAARERKGYSIGWGAILDVFAQRRTAPVVIFAALSHTITMFLAVTGRLEGEIEKAGGRMPAES
jgi:uncharacterized protein YndB with AHSA1/START domain